jgi:alpha-ketoglutaric semialdehyde dehydrogenase
MQAEGRQQVKDRRRIAASYVDGAWISGDADLLFLVPNPADLDDVAGHALWADAETALAAMDAAERAFPAWKAMPVEERAVFIRRILELLRTHAQELSEIITAEQGKTLTESRQEIEATIRDGIYHLDLFTQSPQAQQRPSAQARGECELRYEPLGVTLLITPWNFPLATIGRKLVPALVLGNTAVVKPSEVTPLTAAFLFRLVQEAALPPGVANLVLGEGRVIGPPLITHGVARAISFTGSTSVGLALCRQTAAQDTRLQLEMGGKNALVILADADLGEAVNAGLKGAFSCAGQWCTGTSRLIVQAPVYEEVVARLARGTARIRVGDGRHPSTTMGPLATARQLDRFESAVARAVSAGARLVAGGRKIDSIDGRRGYFARPTVIGEVTPDMAVSQEEIFGPVLAVLRAADADDALRLTNDTVYGLSFSVYTRNLRSAERFIEEVQAGICHVNLPTFYREAHMPICGWKESGRGIPECDISARDFFTRVKAVYRKHS